ncbi:ACP S-malonyltransferase [Hamadaea tsunoensis]|uniref:ACP S-malonyltransferase n=1 Tax=Hamadaea tsunoensis TaxID=53368 RepID=UPI00041C0C57|nr:ACP S-malonyltransferase [Hamadaea tsunoensis]
MSATALIFPGMGPTRFADLGKFLLLNPYARELVAVADERLGGSLLDGLRASESDYTEYAQVSFMISCLALARWAHDELGVTPAYAAGPSFGQKALTAYAGCLPVADAVWMTAGLARCLDEFFATEYTDAVTFSFVRTPPERLKEVLADLESRGEWYDIACYVDDDFYMVTLRERNADWLAGQVRAIGGLPLYTMRPPMHSPAFTALRDKAEHEVLGGLEFADPALPIVSDLDGGLVRTGEAVRAMVLDSVVRPMRWPDVVAALRELEVATVCVAGPDSLFGRVGVTTRNFEVVAANPRAALQPRPRAASVG